LTAKAIEHSDGIVAMTLFFPVGEDIAADKACKLGWLDVTAEWRANLPLTPERVRAMEWTDLRVAASRLGVYAGGKRPEVEDAIIAAIGAETAKKAG
jgi:hypothetical protein